MLDRNFSIAKQTIAIITALAILYLLGCSPETEQDTPANRGLVKTATAPNGVFVHLFEWRWQDIARECETFLGPKGYKAVQISPANEHIDHKHADLPSTYPWWTRYQPVSYKLESRSGTEAELRDMATRCNAVGVDIYADAVINHTADLTDVGIAGTSFNRDAKDYADYSPEDFHPLCIIQQDDYAATDDVEQQKQRAKNIRDCQLNDLPDLDTSSEKVRSILAGYLQSLLDLGVKGFRIDAAKHIHPDDIENVLARLQGDYYLFQEVIDAGNQAIESATYTHIGAVTEFKYSKRIGEIFTGGSLVELDSFGFSKGFLPTEKAVVFIDNHDNQRGHGMAATANHRIGKVYDLANVFMLAWPYGYPKVMSSYDWGGVDDSAGPPHDGKGNTLAVHNTDASLNCGRGAWVCEHRRPAIVNMVEFRNEMERKDAHKVANWWASDDQVAYSRANDKGVVGFTAINRANSAVTLTLQTGLRAGTYCNIVQSAFDTSPNNCVGQSVEVSENGEAELNIAALSAVALY